MNQIDYSKMSDEQLKNYFLAHRNHSDALSTYLQRRKQHKHEIITTVDDPDFDDKIAAAIKAQIDRDRSN